MAGKLAPLRSAPADEGLALLRRGSVQPCVSIVVATAFGAPTLLARSNSNDYDVGEKESTHHLQLYEFALAYSHIG